MSNEKRHFKTLIISDIHLGYKFSRTKEVTNFLKHYSCDTLILCGDIIDGWAILRGKKEKWKTTHSGFIRQILAMQDKTKIYYLRGNHDDFLGRLIPLELNNISLIEDLIYESHGKRYFILHGDVFDSASAKLAWVSKIGSVGYSILLNLNKLYNRYRVWKGLPEYSFAARVKQKVKSSVTYTTHFEDKVINLAKSNNCDAAICGHIHHPEIRQMGDILYMNSGDWVESMTALTEDFEGNWNLIYYKDLNLPEDDVENLK